MAVKTMTEAELLREKERLCREEERLEKLRAAIQEEDRTNTMRFSLAILLLLGTFAIVFVGLFKEIPAEQLDSYLTPVIGLAGAAVGYWFAAAKN